MSFDGDDDKLAWLDGNKIIFVLQRKYGMMVMLIDIDYNDDAWNIDGAD